LKSEEETWPQLLKSISDKLRHISSGATTPEIDPTLVRPLEASFLRTLEAHNAELVTADQEIRNKTHSGELEFQVDKLFQALHTVHAFTEGADKFSSQVLQEAEKVLDERQQRAERTSGTDGWDVQNLLRQVTRA
jgi:Mis12-Mtw1 protein family